MKLVASLNVQSPRNKRDDIRELLDDKNIDILFLTETWFAHEGDEALIANSYPNGYTAKSFPRKRGQSGGGIAIILKEEIASLSRFKYISFASFECVKLFIEKKTFLCIYRPPPSKKNKLTIPLFFEEFQTFLYNEVSLSDELFIVGDLNFHFDAPSHPGVKQIKQLLHDLGLSQFITEPTQTFGHTLDVLICRDDSCPSDVTVTDDLISDHKTIYFSVGLSLAKPQKRVITARNLRSIDINDFKRDVAEVVATVPADAASLNSALAEVLNKHAPSLSRRIASRASAPWMTEEIREARKIRRRSERLWRNTRLTVHKEIFLINRKNVNNLITLAKQRYLNEKITLSSSSKTLFTLTNDLMGQENKTSLPTNTDPASLPNKFMSFFNEKIKKIRDGFSSNVNCNDHGFNGLPFNDFEPVTCDHIKKLILSMPSKSCILDPLPSNCFRACMDELVPVITDIVNKSLLDGVVPCEFKYAIIKPLLKKSNLDPDILKNYRPVSNLPFLSKLLEKVVLEQLLKHLEANNLLEPFQSAYRQGHSTETALLRVVNDLLLAADSGKVSFLSLLDLSAAFDTLDHSVLLDRISSYGCNGTVKKWFSSYLSGRSQSVVIGDKTSNPSVLEYGVPQGSVLGPVLFTLYTTPLSKIIKDIGSSYHMFADDTQLHDAAAPADITTLASKTSDAINNVANWMESNMLKMNEDKTELMCVGSSQKVKNACSEISNGLMIGDNFLNFSDNVKNLGVVLDSSLSMEKHISHLCKAIFFHIRRISRIRHLLSVDCTNKLCVSFILSRLDYCNALLYGLPDKFLDKLQRVQNCAARLVLRKGKRCSASSLLKTLHWLPVRARIEYKIASLCFKCLSDCPFPEYLSDLIVPYSPSRSLRSKDSALLCTPRFNLKTFGKKSFTVAGPVVWNSLPLHLRLTKTLPTFKKNLKTYLFDKYLN